MKLLLYGGTFDPPHQGHINNLTAAIRAVQPDRVVVMPAGVPPHKQASTTPGSVRLAMCQCFLPLHPQLTVSSWELGRQGKNYTIDTVEMLQTAYPGADLYLQQELQLCCLHSRKHKDCRGNRGRKDNSSFKGRNKGNSCSPR